MRERALFLRSNGEPIWGIADKLGIPRSTVGGWLKGIGATEHFLKCLLCGERFAANRSHKKFCCTAHRKKYYDVFGLAT